MYRTRIYATFLLIIGIPLSIASASVLTHYFDIPVPDAPVELHSYVQDKVALIEQISKQRIPKREKVKKIQAVVAEVEAYRKINKFNSGFEEYQADLQIKPFGSVPSELDVDSSRCLQAKDRVMINYDPTVDGYNTHLPAIKNVLQVIDRLCS